VSYFNEKTEQNNAIMQSHVQKIGHKIHNKLQQDNAPSYGRGGGLWAAGTRADRAVTQTFAFKRRQKRIARRQ